MTTGLAIEHVEEGSPAARAGLAVGDVVMSVGGHPLRDEIDFLFHGATGRIALEVRRAAGGDLLRTTLTKGRAGVGLTFAPGEIRRCNNNCIFCFVYQNPVGLRRDLYIKDGDYRLSFLYGNYITGTNLTMTEIERIVEQRLSPLYLSVHATDEAVRARLLGQRRIISQPILGLIDLLTAHGIRFHAQIVLCPGVNDGAQLVKTVRDLAARHPGVMSIAAVPVGLSAHRERLPELQTVTREYAQRFIAHAEGLRDEVAARAGDHIFFLSDEWYLTAGLPIPFYENRPEIPLHENGVGAVQKFYESWDEAALPEALPQPRRVALLTAGLGMVTLRRLVDGLARVRNLEVVPIHVRNTLFGESITVTGLLPGADFQRAIEAHPNFDLYCVPGNALRPWDLRFLDDMTLAELRARTGVAIETPGEEAGQLVAAVLGADYAPQLARAFYTDGRPALAF